MSILLSSPVDALQQYVEHPSVSADSKFASGVVGAREFACLRLKELGFDVDLVDTSITFIDKDDFLRDDRGYSAVPFYKGTAAPTINLDNNYGFQASMGGAAATTEWKSKREVEKQYTSRTSSKKATKSSKKAQQ